MRTGAELASCQANNGSSVVATLQTFVPPRDGLGYNNLTSAGLSARPDPRNLNLPLPCQHGAMADARRTSSPYR
jgi:hypothetical protein